MNKKKKITQKKDLNGELFVADVPLRVSLFYEGKNIFEYDQLVDITFTTSTPEGHNNGAMLVHLKRDKGYSTDNALFLMAQNEFMENEKYISSKLQFPNLKGLEGTHDVQFAIAINGEIQYRKHQK